MATTPQHGFSVPELNKPVLSSLDLLTPSNATEFYRAFKSLTRDSLVGELEASGRVLRTQTEDFKMALDFNKPENLFRVVANVVVVDENTAITVTVANYTDTGETLSAPAVGLTFVESTTGILFEVISVNKTVAGAHTASIKPVSSEQIPVGGVTIPVADAEFISRGRPNVQESSFQQDGEYEGYSTMENFTRIIRTNKKYSDLSTMLALIEFGGRSYYDLDSDSITKQHIDKKERALIDGVATDAVTSTGNQNTDALGLVELVKTYGTSLDGGGTGATLNDAFFLNLSRAIDADGRVDSYRGLIGSEAYYAIDAFLKASGQNIQVVIDNGNTDDIKVIFDYSQDFKIYGVNYNFKKYQYWNPARMSGADSAKSLDAYKMLFVPQGQRLVGSEMRDFLRLRYLDNEITTDEGRLNKVDYDGALFNRNTTRNGEISITSYMGIEATDIDAFVFAQLARP